MTAVAYVDEITNETRADRLLSYLKEGRGIDSDFAIGPVVLAEIMDTLRCEPEDVQSDLDELAKRGEISVNRDKPREILIHFLSQVASNIGHDENFDEVESAGPITSRRRRTSTSPIKEPTVGEAREVLRQDIENTKRKIAKLEAELAPKELLLDLLNSLVGK